MRCKTRLAPPCTSCSSIKMVSSGIVVVLADKVGLPFDALLLLQDKDEGEEDEQVFLVVFESTR